MSDQSPSVGNDAHPPPSCTTRPRSCAPPWAPCAPRWPRPSSGRTPPSPAWSSRCCAAATCCSRACRASPRRCSCARCRRRSTWSTKRVQFTPDLMPGDVTGSLVYDARTAEFSFREGPVFTNLLLADEINRTPPKTQASLLEAMEERQVSVDGTPRPLPDPFLVIATQNPVEYEGTYPLPEAQLDRFLLKLVLPLPERDEEIEVLRPARRRLRPARPRAARACARGRRRRCSARARAEVAPRAGRRPRCSATSSTSAGRPASRRRCRSASRRVARPRCCATSRAWAWLSGRGYVTPDDVKALAHPTLRHRVQLRAEAELEGVTPRACSTRCSPPCPSRADGRGGHLARGRPGRARRARWCSSCPRRDRAAVGAARRRRVRGRRRAGRVAAAGRGARGPCRRRSGCTRARRRSDARPLDATCGRRRLRALVRDAWPPSAGAAGEPAPRRRAAAARPRACAPSLRADPARRPRTPTA